MKIVMLGDSIVGKSHLLQIYLNKCNSESSYSPTVIEIHGKETEKHGQVILVDVSGSDDYDRLRSRDYPTTNAFILVFSFIQPVSYENVIPKWIKLLIAEKLNDTPIVIVGVDADKRDLKNERHIKDEQIQLLLKKIHEEKITRVKYLQCSFENMQEVHQVFETAIEMGAEYSPPSEKEQSTSLGQSRYNFHNENISEANSDEKVSQIQNKIAQKLLRKTDDILNDYKKNFTM